MPIFRAALFSLILCAPAAADCDLSAYQNKIAETEARNQGLEQKVFERAVDGDRTALSGSGLPAMDAAAAMDFANSVVAMAEVQLMHYREAAEIIDEAQRLSPAQLSGLNEANGALFRMTRLLNNDHKAPRRLYTMREVARAVQKAVQSGSLCRADGRLAVTSNFRDAVARELKK